MACKVVVACLIVAVACVNGSILFGNLRGGSTPAATPATPAAAAQSGGFLGGILNKTNGLIGNVKDEVTRLTNETTKMITSVTDEARNFMTSLETNSNCQCAGTACGCCANAALLKMQNKLCVNLSLVPEEMAVKLTSTFNDKTLFSQQVSGKNPPPVCAPLGPLPAITLCVRPYELSLTSNSFRACLQIETSVVGKTVATAGFNCFKVTSAGTLTMETVKDNPAKGYVNFNVSSLTPYLPAGIQQPINLPYPLSLIG